MTIVQLLVITVVCVRGDRPRRDRAAVDDRATGCRWSTWRCSRARWRWLGQTWAQAHLPPTRTAIIMSMEPVFAALFAVLLGGEPATVRMLLGGRWCSTAMLVVELAPRRHIEAEVPHIAV